MSDDISRIIAFVNNIYLCIPIVIHTFTRLLSFLTFDKIEVHKNKNNFNNSLSVDFFYEMLVVLKPRSATKKTKKCSKNYFFENKY